MVNPALKSNCESTINDELRAPKQSETDTLTLSHHGVNPAAPRPLRTLSMSLDRASKQTCLRKSCLSGFLAPRTLASAVIAVQTGSNNAGQAHPGKQPRLGLVTSRWSRFQQLAVGGILIHQRPRHGPGHWSRRVSHASEL